MDLGGGSFSRNERSGGSQDFDFLQTLFGLKRLIIGMGM